MNPNVNDIVTKLFNDHAVPKLICSGRLRRFGISKDNVDLEETEAAVLCDMLSAPEKTQQMYDDGKIMKHAALLIADNVNKEKRFRQKHLVTENILYYYHADN